MVLRILAIGLLLQMFILSCDHASQLPVDTGRPQFSNCTSLSNRVFVAYESPNRFTKPDTVRFSFNYTEIAFDAIKLTASIDSGESWMALDDMQATSDSTASAVWIPREETQVFDYCGKKQCTLKLSATTTDTSFESDPFTVIGSMAIRLDSPLSNDTFSFDDTVVIRYVANTDMVSNVQVFFTHDTTGDWFEITGATSRINDESPIRTMQTLFIPSKYAENIPEDTAQPILFLLRDYNSPQPSGKVISGDHTLLRQ
jgi:hypothetical protein